MLFKFMILLGSAILGVFILAAVVCTTLISIAVDIIIAAIELSINIFDLIETKLRKK